MDRKQIVEALAAKIPDAVASKELEAIDPALVVKPASLHAVCEHMRYEPALALDFLSSISGVDYPDRGTIQVVYHVDSIEHGHSVVLKVDLPRDAAVVDSVHDVWKGADWHERETFDLLGVRFANHPNLVRILCAEDWVGHPLRKDYEWPVEYHGIPCGPFAAEAKNVAPDFDF